MRKQQPADQSNALVPVTESLPAVQIDAPEAKWQQANDNMRENLMRKWKADSADRVVTRGGTVAAAIIMTPALIMMPAMIPVCLIPFSLMAIVGAQAHQKTRKNYPKELERAKDELKRNFRDAQLSAYASQKREIIAAVEQHLGKGGLLSLEDAAWLGNLDPQSIKKSTQQLAITVMQIRKMLAHERCASFNADGSKAQGKPVTFAAQSLRPEIGQHRYHLLRDLYEADSRLPEDNLPVLQDLEFVEQDAKYKTSFLSGMLDFINPASGFRSKRAFKEAQLPRFKPVEIPGLTPVADFAEALENYESHNPPLDLPAVRGWGGGKRKALPAPKGF